MFIVTSLFIEGVHAEERFTEDAPPPGIGYESAMKFFTKTGQTEAKISEDEGARGNSAFLLDHNLFVRNVSAQSNAVAPKWGLSAGYEWDLSWLGSGVYLQYANFTQAEKYTVTGGFYFPRLETGIPVYIRAHIGLGYLSETQGTSGATFDYNASLGLRYFASNRWIFNLELGSRNYSRILKSESVKSIIVASGMAITF
ncbi:MAG: hypothetical protein H6623_02165 [Bdellovibrionaceae bacterium]|nr:hypothetical protein [Pseudobdellovibrionaceae bacterium]